MICLKYHGWIEDEQKGAGGKDSYQKNSQHWFWGYQTFRLYYVIISFNPYQFIVLFLVCWLYSDHLPNNPHSECSSEEDDGIFQLITTPELLSILYVLPMQLPEKTCYATQAPQSDPKDSVCV